MDFLTIDTSFLELRKKLEKLLDIFDRRMFDNIDKHCTKPWPWRSSGTKTIPSFILWAIEDFFKRLFSNLILP